ncbi:MAG TPA: VTT domain-containing protein [Frankiaceae bacterium]|jgi:uncharacterized membrane protein YdjX (TVP38/TMEM64 family)|nr:VTT domain-containing protein [Frankiaceae bacterium]
MTARLVAMWAAVLAALLAVFAVATAAGLPVLDDPAPALRSAGAAGGAVAGVAVLALDVVLPVPSSLVMVAFGAAYGVAAATALSVAGGALMAGVGGTLGRRGARALGPNDAARARRLVDRYGVAAVVLTRPVPLLAESVVLVAGAAGMPLRRLVLGAAAGTLPLALVYAVAGAYGRAADATVAFVVLVLLAAAALATGRRTRCPRGRP